MTTPGFDGPEGTEWDGVILRPNEKIEYGVRNAITGRVIVQPNRAVAERFLELHGDRFQLVAHVVGPWKGIQ